MKGREAIVVIPVHKDVPTAYELISFQQCFRILGNHPVVVVAPQHIKLNAYQDVVPHFKTILIHPKWMSGVLNYNKLKLSQFFYSLFKDYDYLLTYELDAFVFRDNLLEWCDKGYDYVGAPWFEGFAEPTYKLAGVGNSGFSLRKISSITYALKKIHYNDPAAIHKDIVKKFRGSLRQFVYQLRNRFAENISIQNARELNEDIVICKTIPSQIAEFNIAPVKEAIEFSFEVRPDYLFQINYNRLPMGCHAWWRYNLNFWKPHIEKFGYHL
jgi:hypothetical protein